MADPIQFNLLDNAFDYLLSAAEHAKQSSSRSWKYSVLHLVAAVELLLKARLEREHWSLLFADVDKASEAAIKSGDFKSVDFETTYKRLENVAKVALDRTTLQHLDHLRRLRNRIQHFAVSMDVLQVKSLVAKGIDFTIEFCRSELKDEFEARKEEVQEIAVQLRDFQEFAEERLATIATELREAYEPIECPTCWQRTLVIGDGQPHCLFCHYDVSAEELAGDISEGHVETCSTCYEETLAFILANNEEGFWLCTSCGATYDELKPCIRCGRLIAAGGFCAQCEDYIRQDYT